MIEEASLEFRLIKNDETRNHLLDEIKHDKLMSEKYKKTCKYLNYLVHLIVLVLTVTGSVLICAFASLVFVPVRIISSALGINICVISTGIKKYKSIIKKSKRSMIK